MAKTEAIRSRTDFERLENKVDECAEVSLNADVNTITNVRSADGTGFV
jgi:hypothetical protein